MFQVFGDEVYDSNEIKLSLEQDYDIKILSDLTKSTGRDDSIAFKGEVSIDNLDISSKDVLDIDKFDENLKKCELYVKDALEKLNIKYSSFRCRAYKYDENTNSIRFILCIMYIETARKKINDVFKRLLKNND